MGRRPEVFARSLSVEEGRKLARIGRTAKDPVRLRRAIVVLMSAQGQAVPDITSLMQVSADYVRDVIHAFNERGFAALDPKWNGGRPRTIGEQVRQRICLIAGRPPSPGGITAFSTWSLSKLRDHLLDRGTVAAISRETLRRILRSGGVSWQCTSTWKASTDPDFMVKMHRIRRRKRHAEFLDLLKALRTRWLGQKLYIVADNFSPHRHPDVLRWATDNAVELVFLPTYSSWPNWIEAEFTALRYFALYGTDHRTHAEQNAAIAAYIRWRNARARPKTGFATDSPIRTWTDYPTEVA